MSPRKVAYLTPLYFDEASCLGGGERYPLNLGRGVHLASGGGCRVELISFGDSAKGHSAWPMESISSTDQEGLPAGGKNIPWS